MAIEPVTGQRLRIPPGRVAVRLDEEQARAYRALYARYGTLLAGLPVLREDALSGRRVVLRQKDLDALNAAFARLAAVERGGTGGDGAAFAGQERAKNRLFKRLQYLS